MAEESYSGDDESLYDFEHYGTPHQGATPHSGRYKWGSGDEDSLTRANGLLGQVARLKEQGIRNSTEIARALGMTTLSIEPDIPWHGMKPRTILVTER